MKKSITCAQRVLSHEWLINGKLLFERPIEDGRCKSVVIFLHGLLGRGRNLRSPAKLLTEKYPYLQALLLDARGHGKSPSFHPPHDIQNSTIDVMETLKYLNLVDKKSPIAVIGHSFGGRIALGEEM